MKTILLHMGTHKTGSTTLQTSLDAFRQPLREAGVTFLGPGRPYPHLYSAFLHRKSDFIYNRHNGLSEAEIQARDAETLDKLDRRIGKARNETLIVSSEYLSKLSVAEMADMREWFGRHGRVVAVYFYRELPSWIASDSQQMAKVGRTTGPTPFSIAIERVITMPLRIGEVFGADNTVFLRFEDAIVDGICNSFLARLDCPTLASLGLEEIRANEGISANAVRALYAYNRLFPFGSADRPEALMQRLIGLEGPKYQIAGFRPEEIARYAEARAEVLEKLGLSLQDPAELPVSESLDPQADAMAELLETYIARQRG
ncbi:hypothetical protein [Tropicimonas sediminicola]|uniref:Sulfotransferase family protein n=1 Tax=Tropicimonas sediminicola TaxID=1031541 RepID=A0A239KI32_9RHOB|nr:hypothetical protein [Tropicimonas sediminicola]SNT17269.1 hypothetical protein SAMN05421757_107101 [Tropicimonas sediminicola]